MGRRRQQGVVLLRPHLQVAVGGAVVLGAALAFGWIVEPPERSIVSPIVAGGVFCGSAALVSPAAIPWRRFRQRRLSHRAPRGRRPAFEPLADALRRPRWIAWGTVVVALFGLCLGAWSSDRTDAAYERLDRVGLRVPGTVTEVRHNAKGPDFADVEFDLDGDHRTTTLNHHTSQFDAGDEVTVLVDPKNHRRVTVLGVARASGAMEVLEIGGMAAFFILGPFGLVWARRVSLAGDLVTATGWRRFEGHPAPIGRNTTGLQRDGQPEPELVLLAVPISMRTGDPPLWVAGPTSGPMLVRDQAGIFAIARRRVLPTRPLWPRRRRSTA